MPKLTKEQIIDQLTAAIESLELEIEHNTRMYEELADTCRKAQRVMEDQEKILRIYDEIWKKLVDKLQH